MHEFIFGRNPVYETLRSGRRHVFRLLMAEGLLEKGRLTDILEIAQRKKIPIERSSRQSLAQFGENHQGIVLETGDYSYSSLLDILALAEQRGEPPFLLILDTLKDPQNLGALLRTAEVVGVHGVLLPLRQTTTVTPTVVSVSSGASEHLLIAQVNLAQAFRPLKKAGVWVVGLDASRKSQPVEKVRLDGPLALVVGSEGEGLRTLVRDSCDLLIRLPMRGKIESLNAAVAGSVALYMAWQARGYFLDDLPES